MKPKIKYQWTWGLLGGGLPGIRHPLFKAMDLLGSPYWSIWITYSDDYAWNTWNMITEDTKIK